MANILLCKKCLKINDVSFFVNNNLCITCFESPNMNTKICKECKITKCMDKFYKNKTIKDGKSNTCIECVGNNYPKTKTFKTDDTLYSEFLKTEVETTNNSENKLTVTQLFREYRKFLKLKNYKSYTIQQEFKTIMLKPEYLGEQTRNYWRTYKLKNT